MIDYGLVVGLVTASTVAGIGVEVLGSEKR